MKTKNIISSYIQSLLNNTILILLGLLGLVGSFLVDTLFPSINPWLYYAILLVIAILGAGYYAYKNVYLEKQELITKLQDENILLQNKIILLTERQPKINFNLKNEDKTASKELNLKSKIISQNIDFESIVKGKKIELNSKLQRIEKNKTPLASMFNNLGLSPRAKIEEYINSLEKYFREQKEWELFNQKGFLIYPIIKNIGHATANNITIELATTQKNIFLANSRYWRVKMALLGDEFKPSMPIEPDLESFTPDRRFEYLSSLNIGNSQAELYQSNVSLPEYLITDREAIVVYKIEKLVQGISENNVEPFLIWLGDFSENVTLHFQVRIFAEEIMPSPQIDELLIHISLE
jgi:hypothetical protein